MTTPERRDATARRLLINRLVAERHRQGITQVQMAAMLGTTQSNISQFESLGNGDQPRLTTLMRYARALGGTITFTITPEEES